jgi:hypothetical protein
MKINFPCWPWRLALWDWHHRILPDGVTAGYCQRRGRLYPGGGMLISAYAIGVMVGAPLMTLLLSHRAPQCADFPDGDFHPGQRAFAISPDYTTLMLSRIITSLNHGAFFGLGSVVAASVVPNTSRPARWRPCLWG